MYWVFSFTPRSPRLRGCSADQEGPWCLADVEVRARSPLSDLQILVLSSEDFSVGRQPAIQVDQTSLGSEPASVIMPCKQLLA
jgi:hypothetical protein